MALDIESAKDTLSVPSDNLVLEKATAHHDRPTLSKKKLWPSLRNSYYGTLPTVYGILKRETVNVLEKAIAFYGFRFFKKTKTLFESFSAEEKYHTVVAYEHVNMYWKQRALLKNVQVVEVALSWAQANVRDFGRPGLHTMLRILQGLLCSFTNGDFTKGRDSMIEVRMWLINIPLTEYTGVQVKCFKFYFILMLTIGQVQCLT